MDVVNMAKGYNYGMVIQKQIPTYQANANRDFMKAGIYFVFVILNTLVTINVINMEKIIKKIKERGLLQ